MATGPKLAALSAWARLSALCCDRERPTEFTVPRLKVALVKQATYIDLYATPGEKDPRRLLASTWHRTGPLGLFQLFDTDYYLVNDADDPVSQIWRTKEADWKQDSARWEHHRKIIATQTETARSVESIDWSGYDLVIAIENAVPPSLTRAYPAVLWATILEHHRMPAYRTYHRAPPPGYDVFLTQLIGRNALSWIRRPHALEWPYSMTPPNLFAAWFPDVTRGAASYLENHQDHASIAAQAEQEGLAISTPERTDAEGLVAHAVGCRYFLAPGAPRPIYGNAMVDAAAAGCLNLGNRWRLFNPGLILPELHTPGIAATLRMVKELDNDPNRRERIVHRQRDRIDWLVVRRPLLQLFKAARGSGRSLNLLRQALPAR
ncbi:MAG: hypothetical protein ACFB8W_25375 [Elainellaceae cyanobacterium]